MTDDGRCSHATRAEGRAKRVGSLRRPATITVTVNRPVNFWCYEIATAIAIAVLLQAERCGWCAIASLRWAAYHYGEKFTRGDAEPGAGGVGATIHLTQPRRARQTCHLAG